MHIAYLIGNGFDIALGLKTKYSDFYQFYIERETNSELIREFKKALKEELGITDKWSDLELALGQYLQNLSNISQFDELLDDIRFNLSEYLKNVQDLFKSDVCKNIDTKEFLEHLLTPERFLRGRNKSALEQFYSSVGTKPYYFHVISFNYTNSIEQILKITQDSNEHLSLGYRAVIGDIERRLYNLYHVHGSVIEDMILGINDDNQLENLDFRDIPEIRSDFIKPESNLAQGHGVEEECKEQIRKASVICIFGSSLGKTDQLWWDLIAEQLRERECRLVIFDYKPYFLKLNSSRSFRFKQEIIGKIFGNVVPSDVNDKVYVNFNSDLFNSDMFNIEFS